MFDRADTTRSGTLTLDELTAALCRVDPALEESAVSEIMAMLDLEAAGSVSFKEVRRTGPACSGRFTRAVRLAEYICRLLCNGCLCINVQRKKGLKYAIAIKNHGTNRSGEGRRARYVPPGSESSGSAPIAGVVSSSPENNAVLGLSTRPG